ncbi:MAG TPA: DUF998 domain-containing protein [Gemmatimonadales bacterium]|nr:DUF998 domain-containing protein [Gemmatimonadales bacterium]
MTRKVLLTCGVAASVLYAAMNVIAAVVYQGYSSISQTVSELSAIGAPTRGLWVALATVYSLLVMAFGWGVWRSGHSRPLRIVGGVMIAQAVIGLAWPPMHQREVLAMGGGTLTDKLHIVWAIVTSLLFLLAIAFGAAALGKRFRRYSIATAVILLLFGALTGMVSPGISANLPTPLIGVWERINIGAYMLWVAVLAIGLLRVRAAGSVHLQHT